MLDEYEEENIALGLIWFENMSFSKNEIIARLHERLLTIHPFVNGNGRWSKILTEFICLEYEVQRPAWAMRLKDDLEKRRKEYISSVEKARYTNNYSTLMENIFS